MADRINYDNIKSSTGLGITPVGTILPWSQATAPTGFLKCDGSAVSRSTYADLFAVIGTNYGVGDGSTTFNLPDLQSRNCVGANTSTSVGQSGGVVDTDGAGFALQNNLTSGSFNNLSFNVSDNLAIQTQQNLATPVSQNLGASSSSNLEGSVTQNLSAQTTSNLTGGALSGSVTAHTLSLAQITAHNHPGTFGGNTGTGAGDFSGGNIIGSPPNAGMGNVGSNQSHTHGDNLSSALTGNVALNITGNVAVNLPGNVSTNLTGNVAKNVSGSVTNNLTGSVATNLTGELNASVNGDVTVDNASLYAKHLVVIYIIKH